MSVIRRLEPVCVCVCGWVGTCIYLKKHMGGIDIRQLHISKPIYIILNKNTGGAFSLHTLQWANLVRVSIEEAPLEEDEEHQPSKEAHEEEELRNKLHDDVQVAFEVSAIQN